MNVEKISIKKVSESVVEQIEEMIESGSIETGEKLPSVRELCDMFGVGRSAIRDAIITLKGKGIVDVKQGQGTFIRRFDTKKLFNPLLINPESNDVRELFQVRKLLEPGIAEMAALNWTEQDMSQLERCFHTKSSYGWEEDYHFHMTIAKASKNQIIFQLLQFISTTTKKHMIEFHRYIEQNHSIFEIIAQQHRDIFEAIKESDSLKAKNKMTEHLEYVESIMQKSLWKSS
ncbi:FadR/GntR family transcriptional regulator [Robertmurraya massiliosenegalensis]|uniref:FadR/GntR family transcriptional regulator n=1 Tax=Robertmurraya massiliosenegalensis TaxID=1287657 RepID=UPI0002F73E58|nr:FadR/GntR family transcriptional regulator [Robertmurraya massiliosenegalensis]